MLLQCPAFLGGQQRAAPSAVGTHAAARSRKASAGVYVDEATKMLPNVYDVSMRMDLAFKALFRRGTVGAKPGSPRLRG